MRSQKLIRGAFLNTVNLVAQILSGFYVMPLTIHTFGDAMFGVWILVSSFMGYAAILNLGLPSAVSRFIAQAIGRGGKEGDRAISHITATAFYIFLFISFLTLCFIALVFALTPFFMKDHAQAGLFRELLLILCLNNIFMFPAFIFEGVLAANLRLDIVNARKVVFTVLRVVLTIMIIRLHGGLAAIAWATVTCNIVENFMVVYLSYRIDRRTSILPSNVRPEMVAQLFGYSIYTFIGKIADTLRFQIDSCVITIFCGVAQVTPFRVASRLIEYFMQLISGVTSGFSPYFSQEEGKKNFAGMTEKFFLITKVTTYLAAFAGLILLLFGKYFIDRWVGPGYPVSYDILVVLAVPLTIALMQSTVFTLLYGISKHRFVAFMNTGEGIANLILSVVLVRKYGILGVALGTAIPLLVTKLLIQPVYATRIIGISLWDYIASIARPFLKTALALLLPWLLIRHSLRPDYLNLLFFGTLQTAIFCAMLFLCGFTDAEKKYLKGIFKNKKIKESVGY